MKLQVAHFVKQREEKEALKKRLLEDTEKIRKRALLEIQQEELRRLKERVIYSYDVTGMR
jgi:hypothetical protein